MKNRTQQIGIAGLFAIFFSWVFAVAPGMGSDPATLFSPSWTSKRAPVLLAKKDTDTPKKEIPTYEKAMREAVNQFLAVVESIDKKNQPKEWKLQQIFQFNQSVRWGPDAQLTYYIFDEQMRLLDCVDFRQFIGKDFYEWADTSGRKPFQTLKKGILEKGLETVELTWPLPKGQFPVPSKAHGQPYQSLNITITVIIPDQFLAAFEEIYRTVGVRLKNDPPENRRRGSPDGSD